MSQTAYAERVGVSQRAVAKAIKAGRISLEPDGKIDPEKADAEWDRNTRNGGLAALPTKATAPPPPALKGTNGSAPEAPGVNVRDRQQAARTEDLSGRARMTLLKVGQLEGRLVEREKAEAYVFARMRQIRDAWLAFPARIAEPMAADLDIEDVQSVERCLDTYVQEHLEMLAGIEPEGIDE